MTDAYRMVPDAAVRQHNSVTNKWRCVCQLDGCDWTSTDRDTAEEVDTVAIAHLEAVHGASQVIKTP